MFPNYVPRRTGVVNEFPVGGRSNRSYPVQLDLRYKVIHDGKPLGHGSGRTRQFSSSVLVFTADQPLSTGAVELALDWPFLLDGVCPLQLVVFGHVLHGSNHVVTVKIARHEFRTRRPSLSSKASHGPESHIIGSGA